MEIVALFALTALLLAGLGIYGVISYVVSERTYEIGIRLALGAERRSILQLVLHQRLGLALAGAAVGLVGALVVSHLMTGLLYGVKPTDPLSFAGVAFLLITVALFACYIAARARHTRRSAGRAEIRIAQTGRIPWMLRGHRFVSRSF